MISKTPKPPYYAVIFTSFKAGYSKEYDETSKRMIALVSKQQGFLGIESSRDEIGITISYWDSLDSIKHWKNEFEHKIARQRGRDEWYSEFKVRIALVERDYSFVK
jgi:heme-degrading monooxygenase HmoA